MIVNTAILTALTLLVLFLSEKANKKFGKKVFPGYTRKIKKTEEKLEGLKNLIRLTFIHKDEKTREKLQKEYSELHSRIFFVKMATNTFFLVPYVIYGVVAYFVFRDKELLLPPINYIILILGVYFIVKFLAMTLKNLISHK